MKRAKPRSRDYARTFAVAGWFLLAGWSFGSGEWIYDGGALPRPQSREESPEVGKTKNRDGAPTEMSEIEAAAQRLFKAGWADPRGGEYREIVIPGGDPIYPKEYPVVDSGQFLTHGWVLPEADGRPHRYAVAWDGLVYPAISVGKPADLQGDVGRALTGDVAKPPPETETPGPAFDRVSPEMVVMLLRLGMPEEAAKAWRRWKEIQGANVPDDDNPGSFASLAKEWLRVQLVRAIWAHRRGQLRLALVFLEPIPEARRQVEAQMARPDPARDETEKGSLAFLDQVPALIAEEQRRIAENVTSRPEILDPESVKDKAARIALLIRDLEEVDAHPCMSPGYISFPPDPVVVALVAQGEDAVEPLIDALANDTRLTRTIDGDSWTSRRNQRVRVVGVEEPALAALEGILRSREQFQNLDVPYVNCRFEPVLKRRELAQAIRSYWEKYRGKPLPERWYGLLLDDEALPRVWAEAVENLTLKESQPVPVYGEFMPPFLQTDHPDRMRGEDLRETAKPSVSELMAKRLKTAFEVERTSPEPFAMAPARKLAMALAKWDGKREHETLRWYCQELEEAIGTQPDFRSAFEPVNDLIAVHVARAEAGDETALAEYAKWLRGADAKALSKRADISFFAPLWLYSRDPGIQALTRWLFADRASPWIPGAEGVNPTWVSSAASTPLVAARPFRELLLDQLNSPLVVGSAELKPGGHVAYFFPYVTVADAGDAESLTEPKQDVRLGDKIADRLSRVRGVPAFSPQWPKQKRDQAISDIAKFVRQYGDRWTPKTQQSWDSSVSTEADLRFPILDHPATKEDVAQGRAIFSNDGAAERSIWPLPETPIQVPPSSAPRTKGQWITLKEYPAEYRMPNGTQAFDQEVDVWQAEKAVIKGERRRMFGVVARNRVAVVPASEIEFGTTGGDGWALWAQFPDLDEPAGRLPTVPSGKPFTIAVWIQNQRGAPQDFSPPGQGASRMRAKDLGIELNLEYFQGPFRALQVFGARPQWKKLEPHDSVMVDIVPGKRTLEALERTDFLRFDLRSAFDLDAPGIYRLVLKLKKNGTFEGEKYVSAPRFEVKK